MDMITEYHADGDYEIISIGSVGSDFFKARGMNVALNFVDLRINQVLNK